jgi:aryl-phospho-beta-D-glucosidase BglC (GH1 family)
MTSCERAAAAADLYDNLTEKFLGGSPGASPAPGRAAARWRAVAAAVSLMTLASGVAAAQQLDSAGPSGRGGWLLPSGFLSTSGGQIVDAAGNPVRIASINWDGGDNTRRAPFGLDVSPLWNNVSAIKYAGFNTIRVPWSDVMMSGYPAAGGISGYNPTLIGKTSLQVMDELVTEAGSVGLKVIFDHHNNEGHGGAQRNGLWFDLGPGSDGTDGMGHTGTVTAEGFKADWVALAARYAGNATVIGFDLHNEPNSLGRIVWGGGGPTDILAMFTSVGNAIQAVDPGALIICEGPEEFSGPTPTMPAGFAAGDLSGVAMRPVTLRLANKVVYSTHIYPPTVSGNGSYVAATEIAAMNAGFGYLVRRGIAPVWIGETGSNLSTAADAGFIQLLIDYANGLKAAAGGPGFSGAQQPISMGWWYWGINPRGDPGGLITTFGTTRYRPRQLMMTDQFLYRSRAVK